MADLKTRIVITSSDQSAAGIKSARAGLTGLDNAVKQVKSDVIAHSNQITSGIKSARVGLTGLDNAVKQVKNSLLALAGVSLGIGLVKSIADTADQMTELEGRLAVVVDAEKDLAAVENELFEASQRTGTAYQENVTLFTRLQPAIEQLGGDYQTTIQLTESVAQSLRLSGASAAEAAGLTLQLSQALQSGVLRGDEFNSVVENGGYLARKLADGLGVTVGELRNMAFAGQLTSDVVVNTLLKQSASINEEFGKIPETLSSAFTKLNNAWEKFLGDLNKSTGATNTVAEGIAFVARHFDTLANAALHVGEVFLVVYAVKAVTALKATITQLIATAQANRLAAATAMEAANAEVARTAAVVQSLEAQAAQLRIQLKGAQATFSETKLKQELILTEQRLRDARLAEAAAIQSGAAAASASAASLLSIGTALNAAIAGFAGFKLGEFLREEFVEVKIIGNEIMGFFLSFATYLNGVLHLDSNIKITEDLRRIRHELTEINKGYVQEAQANDGRQRIVEVNKQIAKSFEAVKVSVKAVGEAMEGALKQGQHALEQQSQNRLTDINQLVENERARQILVTAEIIRAGNEQTQLAQKYAEQRAQLIVRTFQDQINAARQLGARTVEIERESLEQRKAIYEQLVTNYKSVIDRLIAEEKRFLDQARDYARQRADLTKNTEQRITEFYRSGMSDVAKQADIVRERDELNAKAREQFAKGFYEEALETTKRVEELSLRSADIARDLANQTKDLAKQSQQAWEMGNEEAAAAIQARIEAIKGAMTESADTAIQNVRDANQIAEDALKGMEAQARSAAEAARTSYQQLIADMNAAQKRVNVLTEQLQQQTVSEHKVNIDAEKALETIEQLKQPTQSTHTINVVENNQAQQRRLGGPIYKFSTGGHTPMAGLLPGYGGGDRVKALLEAGEFIIRKEAVLKYGQNLFEQLNAMRIQPNKIVEDNTGQKRRIGGPILKFAIGGYTPMEGMLPGFGGGDRIKALLEGGEFIIRKESVQKYGQNLFEQLNAMRIQPDKIIKRKIGGIVPIRRAVGGVVPIRRAVGGIVDYSKRGTADNRNESRLLIDFDLGWNTINGVLDRFKSGWVQASQLVVANLQLSNLQLNRDIADIGAKAQTEIDAIDDKFGKTIANLNEQFKKTFATAGAEFERTMEGINKSKLSVDRTIDDAIRNIKRQGLTEEEQYVDKVKEIREKEQLAKEALARGDVEEAQRLNAEIVQLAQQISGEVTDSSGNIIVQQQDAAAQAIEFLNSAKALNAQISAEEQNQARQAYDVKRAGIAAEQAAQLATINAEKAAEIAAINDVKVADIAAANEAHQLRMSQIKQEGDQRTRFLTAQNGGYGLKVFGGPSGGAEFGYRTGAYPWLRAATGGQIPGHGDGDTVPSMLTPGEWVIKKSSVAKYGNAFMDAVNRGMLPVRKFASGGAVTSGGRADPGLAISLALGGAQTTGTLDRGSATDEIIEALKAAGMVS